jgi:multidrug efflux system membrane fusion protein
VDQGNIVHANDATGIVVITQVRPISVVFTFAAQNLGQVQDSCVAAGGSPVVLAMDRDNRTVLGTGKLAVIDNQIDSTTDTIRLKATFPNDDLKLWPGQFINARLLLQVRKGGAVVPASVVQRGPNGPFAYVIDDDLKARVRPIKVAQIQLGQALIEEGLRPGERVVVDGQYKLQAGSKVKLAEAGGPRPEVGGQRAEDGGQKVEGGGERTEGGGKRAEPAPKPEAHAASEAPTR